MAQITQNGMEWDGMTDEQPKRGPGRPRVYGKRQNFNFRITDETKARLIESATRNGRSLSEEIEHCLTRSFAGVDILAEALGGHEMRHLAISVASAFADGCRGAASDAGHDDWAAKDWLKDRDCCRAGIAQAVTALLESAPDFSPEETTLLLFDIKNRLAASLVRSGALKFDFGDGRGSHGNEFVEPSDEERKAEDAADKAADETRHAAEAVAESRFALLYRAVELKLELGEEIPTEAELHELNQYCEAIGRLHKLAEARRSNP